MIVSEDGGVQRAVGSDWEVRLLSGRFSPLSPIPGIHCILWFSVVFETKVMRLITTSQATQSDNIFISNWPGGSPNTKVAF